MLLKTRKTALIAAISVALAGSASAARDDSKASVHGDGVAVSQGVIKTFQFNAVQKSATSLLAHGGVYYDADDVGGNFSSFTMIGKVTCLKLTGTYATVGLVITDGIGSAADHIGEGFYITVRDNGGVVPDAMDNSGYTGVAGGPDCNYTQEPFGPLIEGDVRVRQDDWH